MAQEHEIPIAAPDPLIDAPPALPVRAALAERVAHAACAVATLFVLHLAYGLHPDARGHGTHEQLGLRPCTFKVTTGYPCMTCGMTTAFSHMAHLEPLDALRVQPAGAVLFVLALAYVPTALWASARGRSLLALLDRAPARWFAIGLLVMFGGAWLYTAIRFGG